MITRRSITKSLAAGAGLLGFLGLAARADAPKANRRHKPIPPHQTPTMDLLINIVELDKGEKRKYYLGVLDRALAITGPIYWDLIESRAATYFVGPIKPGRHNSMPTRSAFAVLVPDAVLPNIRYAERGEGYQRDVPFMELA